jgi:AcrR family transcriptional regulator
VQAEKFDEAGECFRQAIAINPRCGCSIPGYTAVLARQPAALEEISDLLQGFIQRMPENPNPHLSLASVLFRAGRVAESLAHVRWLADHVDDSSLPQFIQVCVLIARGGERANLLRTVLASGSRQYFEPLVVALGLEDGDEPNVAREVLEVAKDIHRRIVGDDAAIAVR